jgi:hypothetical protein
MRLKALSLLAGLIFPITVSAAHASVYYNFSFEDYDGFNNVDVGAFNGVLKVDHGLITGITGSGSGIGTITALFPSGSNVVDPIRFSDNEFSPTPPYLDFAGLIFDTSSLGPINLFQDIYGLFPGAYAAIISSGHGSQGVLSVSLSPVPLPSSAPMFGAALLTLIGLGYGLKRKGAARGADQAPGFAA